VFLFLAARHHASTPPTHSPHHNPHPQPLRFKTACSTRPPCSHAPTRRWQCPAPTTPPPPACCRSPS
jgi:hypothetical protein